MQFHEWYTQYDWIKSGLGPQIPAEVTKDPSTFYSTLIDKAVRNQLAFTGAIVHGPVIETNHAICERLWYKEDKPYFRIWPEMLEILATTRIDIPNKHLIVPYDSFVINLPVGNELIVAPGYELKSLMVCRIDERVTSEGLIENSPALYVWMDYGEFINGEPIRAFQRGDFTDPEKNIEACFDLDPHESWYTGIAPQGAMRMAILRIVAGVCLLATSSSKVIEPDILARHLEQWKTATEARRKELVKKARQRGKFGFKVKNPDHDRVLVGNLMDAIHDEHECRGTRRPLKYSHLRRCHWHIVRHGPLHSLTKVMLFAETEVKKGLPRRIEI